MPLVPAKCPECGGNINIDPTKRAGICEYCKQPFVVEDAINNFNTTYNITNNNEIKADVVNVYDNSSKEFEIKAGVLLAYHGESRDVVIPDNVVEISNSAFKEAAIESIYISKNVDSIAWRAFARCKKLKKVAFDGKSQLEIIDSEVFYSSEKLETVILPRNLKCIEDYAFSGCHNLKEIVLPRSLEKIGRCAFMECYSLESIIIPDGIEEIGDEAFSTDYSLQSIVIPKEKIGLLTHAGIIDTKIINNKNITEKHRGFFLDGLIDILRVPDGTTDILPRDFDIYSCSSKNVNTAVKHIVLPSTVRNIWPFAFACFSNVTEIVIPEGVEYIGNHAFLGCKELQKIQLPSTLKRLEKYAFKTTLSSGYGYFSSCDKLKCIISPQIKDLRSFVNDNLEMFSPDCDLVRRMQMAKEFCLRCGGDYIYEYKGKGSFKKCIGKTCTECGYSEYNIKGLVKK